MTANVTAPNGDRDIHRPETLTFDVLAQRALRELEGTDAKTPPAAAIAHGLTAVAYAVLALRETTDSIGIDLGNVLSEASEHIADAATHTGRAADTIADASWPKVLARTVVWRLYAAFVRTRIRIRYHRAGRHPVNGDPEDWQ
jgi:hypothetical protein